MREAQVLFPMRSSSAPASTGGPSLHETMDRPKTSVFTWPLGPDIVWRLGRGQYR